LNGTFNIFPEANAFGLLVSKGFLIIWLSNLLTINVSDEDYFRKGSAH
jgi:hypothetical protein